MNKILVALILCLFTSCSSLKYKPDHLGEPAVKVKFDAELSKYRYPFPVKKFSFTAQKQSMQMSYMDLNPGNDAPVVVILHGKNFGGYAYAHIAAKLDSEGYRVILPDQIGFGKSSKPDNFQFTFQALATNTNQLLESLGVKNYILLGHSMGGMLATRMALMYPEKVSRLILLAPLGLEDWKLLTPYKTVDELYAEELKATPASIKAYQQAAYYSGEWKPEYDWLIEAGTGWTQHPDYPRVAWNSALTYDMILTQPVIYEFPRIKVPTHLIIGLTDKTAPGKGWAPEENKKKMGLYPELGRNAIKLIPGAKLHELPGLGHVPFVQNFEEFWEKGLSPALKGAR